MELLVRLYAHYANATFLHKFAQAVPSRYRQRYCFVCKLGIKKEKSKMMSKFFIIAISIFLAGCVTSKHELIAMEKIEFVDSVDSGVCKLVQDVTCQTIRVNVGGDVCGRWLRKRAVRIGGTHVVTYGTLYGKGNMYSANGGVIAKNVTTNKSVPAKIYNCSTENQLEEPSKSDIDLQH